jgi:cell division protease FtsH
MIYKFLLFVPLVASYLPPVPINKLISDIQTHQIKKLTIKNDLTKAIIENIDSQEEEINISPLIVQKLVDTAISNDIETSFINQGFNFQNVIAPAMFLGSLLFVNNVFSRNNPLQRPQMDTSSITILSNVTLDDWAGSEEVKFECAEIVSYLRNNTNYVNVGAKIPKGILLEGPPGTGKTLLAKAIANEAEAYFISITGSEFVELFVGLGAARVRQLFKDARKNKPTIIFIDEIDAIGRQRGTGLNMGNDEREQTLNQLLAEMDGFVENGNGDIIVLAATNRKDVLDSALLRPGRFDRLINIPLPDTSSRIQILNVHARNKQISEDVNFDSIAKLTNGFSGAQLENLINEAAIIAARNGDTVITSTYILDALEKITVGIIKKTETRGEETIERVALHELGHSLLVLFFKNYFKLEKVSIQASYSGAGGYTLFDDLNKDGLYTKNGLKSRLAISLGGKAAETIFYGEEFCSSGAVQDLAQANSLARKMAANFGMSKDLEVFYDETVTDQPFIGRTLGMQTTYSDATRRKIDTVSLELLTEGFEIAKSIIAKNKHKINKAMLKLLEKKVLTGEELEEILKD